MFNEKQVFGAPAFPLEDVRDPTGAGIPSPAVSWDT